VSDDPTDSENVGRAQPPISTQFRPGESGNKKGRPKGSKNISSVIREEMDTRFQVTENGRRKRITKREAVAKQLVNKAVAGDPKATAVLMTEERQKDAAGSALDGQFADADRITIANILCRMRASVREEILTERGEREEPSEPAFDVEPQPSDPDDPIFPDEMNK
jgi:hypothetical protein